MQMPDTPDTIYFLKYYGSSGNPFGIAQMERHKRGLGTKTFYLQIFRIQAVEGRAIGCGLADLIENQPKAGFVSGSTLKPLRRLRQWKKYRRPVIKTHSKSFPVEVFKSGQEVFKCDMNGG